MKTNNSNLMYFQNQATRNDLRNETLSSRALYRNSRSPGSLFGVAMLLLASIAPASLGQTIYSVTNLAARGMSSVKGLNNRGEVAGGNGQHALLFSGGMVIDLGTLGGTLSDATAINDNGQVVGTSRTAGNESHGFLYSSNGMTDLGAVAPTAINNSGVVVGSSEGYYGPAAVIYKDGGWTNILNPLFSYHSYAYGVNSSRQTLIRVVHPTTGVTGYYLHSDGVLTGFDYAAAINESGQVVGSSGGHAFLYSGGVISDLGTLGGDYSTAYAINDNGQIVGTSTTSNGTTRAFIYSEGTMRDLGYAPDLMITRLEWDTTPGALQFIYTNSITPVGAGLAWHPIAINDQGQILRSDSLLLTPMAPTSTSAKLFWANGVGLANKISSTPIFTHTIPAGSVGNSAPVEVPASSLQNPPTNATHVLLVIDPDNLIAESNEGNNTSALNITRPDLRPLAVAWNTSSGGLDFSYIVEPGTLAIAATTVKLFWAKGATIASKISPTPVFTQDIPAGFSGDSPIVPVPPSSFSTPPKDATHILIVVDPDNLIAESTENNNTAAIQFRTVAELSVIAIRWNKISGGLVIDYTVQGKSEDGTSVSLFWATSEAAASIIPGVVTSRVVPPFNRRIFHFERLRIDGKELMNAPGNATHIIAKIDGDNQIGELNEDNNWAAVADVQIAYEDSVRDEGNVSARSQKIIKNFLRRAGQPNALITSTYRDATNQARVMFENLVLGSGAKYGALGQMVVNEYKTRVAGHTKAWICEHAEEIISSMRHKIEEIGWVPHHSINPEVLNVIDIAPSGMFKLGQCGEKPQVFRVEGCRFTSSAMARFSCAASEAKQAGIVSEFHGPQTVTKCKPAVQDPAFHLEIIP